MGYPPTHSTFPLSEPDSDDLDFDKGNPADNEGDDYWPDPRFPDNDLLEDQSPDSDQDNAWMDLL